MSEHKATIRWQNSGGQMDYVSYSRDHTWDFEGGPSVAASAAAAYRGGPGRVDPEEALVASASACHMLTFLAIASRKRLVVATYEDAAVGHLEKDAEGRLAVTRIELRPRIRFAPGTTVPAEDLARMHETAHRECFIANSIRTEVTVVPT
jgi:organic hydroperoxide reductase OsmC/OhrA